MSDFPIPSWPCLTITPYADESVGPRLTSMANAAAPPPPTGAPYPTANLAIYIPLALQNPITVVKLFACNTSSAPSGNIDVGLYGVDGTQLASAGSTAQASNLQEFNIADISLPPGHYFLAVAMDNTTGQMQRTGVTTGVAPFLGMYIQAAAFPLPNPAVFATAVAHWYLPMIGLTTRVVI